ncbi:hypothetical protein Q7P37_011244 [Cladosporium fusiforme]
MASTTTSPPSDQEEDLLICTACGTEFDQPANQPLDSCVICDDPRQFVPPQGQTWTSHVQMTSPNKNNNDNNIKYTNTFQRIDSNNPNLYSLTTTPKFGIGQRAILLKTPSGNILWDCLTLLDAGTEAFIKSHGGLRAIVISHPHYYTTHLRWGAAFDCPVYVSREDEVWTQRVDHGGVRRYIEVGEATREIVPGVTAIKTGGHFPGSLVLHWDSHLFIADSLVTVPSALYHRKRPKGTSSYAFMWSIPNMIPLPPAEMRRMWRALEPWEFSWTHGAFVGLEVRDADEEGGGRVKERVRESMRIQAGGEGWDWRALGEGWP